MKGRKEDICWSILWVKKYFLSKIGTIKIEN